MIDVYNPQNCTNEELDELIKRQIHKIYNMFDNLEQSSRIFDMELESVFGSRNWVDARYDRTRNQCTPRLKELYENHSTISKLYCVACDELRRLQSIKDGRAINLTVIVK